MFFSLSKLGKTAQSQKKFLCSQSTSLTVDAVSLSKKFSSLQHQLQDWLCLLLSSLKFGSTLKTIDWQRVRLDFGQIGFTIQLHASLKLTPKV